MLRLARFRRLIKRWEEHINAQIMSMMQMIMLFFAVLFSAHVAGCAWHVSRDRRHFPIELERENGAETSDRHSRSARPAQLVRRASVRLGGRTDQSMASSASATRRSGCGTSAPTTGKETWDSL